MSIIIYTTLITLGSEIRHQEGMIFLFFVFIGKKKKRKFHPSPRGGVRYRCFITKFTNSQIHTFTRGGGV